MRTIPNLAEFQMPTVVVVPLDLRLMFNRFQFVVRCFGFNEKFKSGLLASSAVAWVESA